MKSKLFWRRRICVFIYRKVSAVLSVVGCLGSFCVHLQKSKHDLFIAGRLVAEKSACSFTEK